MQIENFGSNQVVVWTNGATVFYSYNTPVAAYILGRGGYDVSDSKGRATHYVKTSKFWSVTTSKHINSWLRSKGIDPKDVETVDQEYLDKLI
jgi:ABC-type nitrate/sulfonate/bicarbonate transport system substrate-binding protein